MKHMKKLIVLVLAVALILSLSGCLVQVNEEKNRNIVVATITDENGNVTEIKKGDFLDLYQYYYMQYYYTYYYYYNIDLGSNDADAVEARNAIKDNVLDSLVNTQVYTLEMELAGYEVNDDDRKKAQEEYDTAIDDLAKSYMEEDDVEEDTDGVYRKRAEDYFAEQIAADGMTLEEYMEEMAKEFALERFFDDLVADVEATEEEVQEDYNATLEAQKKTPDMDADVIVFQPESFKYKVLEFKFTEEEQDEYDELVDADKDDEAQAYKEEKLKAKADDFYRRLQNGEDFDALLEELAETTASASPTASPSVTESPAATASPETTESPDATQSPDSTAAPEDGEDGEAEEEEDEDMKTFYVGVESGYAGTFDDEIIKVNVGNYTAVLESGDFYLIAKVYEIVDEKTYTYDEVKDKLKEALDEEKKDEALTEQQTAMIEKYEIVKYNKRTYKDY